MTANTKTLTVTASDGSTLKIVVPTDLPDNDRADYLRGLYNAHVKPLNSGDSWKDACFAVVPAGVASDVAEAMDFHGSIVDARSALHGGLVYLFSEGYWAHGF